MDNELKKRFLQILINLKNGEIDKVRISEIADFTNDLVESFSEILLEISDDKELNVAEQEKNKAQFQMLIDIVQSFYQKYFGISCNNTAIKNKLKTATPAEIATYSSYFAVLLDRLENYIKQC